MKVLASDFDGTLFFGDHFKEEDIKAVKQFQSVGNLFGLCTGRPLNGITKYTEGIFDFDFYILSTGSLILDKELNVLYQKCLCRDTIRKIYETYKDETNIMIQANKVIYAFDEKRAMDKRYLVSSVDEIEGNEFYSVSLNCFKEEKASELCKELKEKFDDIDAFVNKEYIDVIQKGCSKGEGILLLKKLFNIEHIAGIGDSYNDVPMLDTVDLSFTFTDSPKSVQQHADKCVSSVSQAISIL